MTDASSQPVLRLAHITKRFGSLVANDDISLSLGRGEVLALLGENGAGKSTLIKGIAGIYPFDSGEYFFEGRPAQVHDPKQANDLGIEVVYQDLALAPDLAYFVLFLPMVLVLVFLLTGWIEPCEDGHKCPTPVATIR